LISGVRFRAVSQRILTTLATAVLLYSLLVFPAHAATGQWSTNGPFGGDIPALVVSPDFAIDQTVFVIGGGGGVFRSTNGGSSWTSLNTGLTDLHLRSIAVSPDFISDQTVFAGTLYGGIFRSTNAGLSWTAVGLAAQEVRSIAISPQFEIDRTVFAGTPGEGVFRSSDGGSSWTPVNSGMTSTYISAIALSPDYATDRTVFAGTAGGLFKSTDEGASWQRVDSGFTVANVPSIALSPTFASDQTVFAGTFGGGVYKSTDGGSGWSQLSTAVTGTEIYAVALSPAYALDHTVFTGAYHYRVAKSTDGGSSWSTANNGILSGNTHLKAVAVSPYFATDQTVFAGSDDYGVYRSTDGAASWVRTNSGLSGTNIMSLAASPGFASDNTLFAGCYRGGLFRSTNGGADWNSANHELQSVGSIALSPEFPTEPRIFAATAYGVYRSLDGGTTWSNTRATFTWSLAISPGFGADNTIFAGTYGSGVLKSSDGGSSWTAANSGLTATSIFVLSISPGFATDQTIFAGGSPGGVFKSSDGGHSWTSVSSGIVGSSIRSLAISPDFASDQTIFAATDYGVFKSTNGGGGWSQNNSGLPTDPPYPGVTSVAVSPDFSTDRTVFAATETKVTNVYRSTDAGQTWAQVPSPRVTRVTALTPSPTFATDHTLFAETLGGVHAYTFLPDTAPPVTTLSTWPSSPDGASGWYTSLPLITLTSNESGSTWYKWDTDTTYTAYLAPVTAPEGEHTLSFYSVDSSCNTETAQARTFKVDTQQPTRIGRLRTNDRSTGSVTLNWQAPADNLAGGTCDRYDIRYSTVPLSETTWESAVQASNEPTPLAQWTTQAFLVSGLDPETTYYFGIKAFDEAGNSSQLSNLTRPVTLAEPSTPTVFPLALDNEGSSRTDVVETGGFSLVGDGYYLDYADVYEDHNSVDFTAATIGYGSNSDHSFLVLSHPVHLNGTYGLEVTLSGAAGGSCAGAVDAYVSTDAATWSFLGRTESLQWLGGNTDVVSAQLTLQGSNLYLKLVPSSEPLAAALYVEKANIRVLEPEGVSPHPYTVTITPGNVTLSFDSVTDEGASTAQATSASHLAPANFRLLRGGYYDISTTAVFTGYVTVTIPYDETDVQGANESNLKLFHWKDNGWQDITVSIDTDNNTITGRTDSFSDFGVFEPLGESAPISTVPASPLWSVMLLSLAGAIAVGMGARRGKARRRQVH